MEKIANFQTLNVKHETHNLTFVREARNALFSHYYFRKTDYFIVQGITF